VSLRWLLCHRAVAKILEHCISTATQPSPHLVMTDSENTRLAVMNPLDVAHTRCLNCRYKWIIKNVKERRFHG
jgi:hypothetical protein